MKPIEHFQIRLTQKQAQRIRGVWQRAGKNGAAMLIAQPITTCGPFTLRRAILDVAIIGPEDAALIQDAMRTPMLS